DRRSGFPTATVPACHVRPASVERRKIGRSSPPPESAPTATTVEPTAARSLIVWSPPSSTVPASGANVGGPAARPLGAVPCPRTTCAQPAKAVITKVPTRYLRIIDTSLSRGQTVRKIGTAPL